MRRPTANPFRDTLALFDKYRWVQGQFHTHYKGGGYCLVGGLRQVMLGDPYAYTWGSRPSLNQRWYRKAVTVANLHVPSSQRDNETSLFMWNDGLQPRLTNGYSPPREEVMQLLRDCADEWDQLYPPRRTLAERLLRVGIHLNPKPYATTTPETDFAWSPPTLEWSIESKPQGRIHVETLPRTESSTTSRVDSAHR